MSSNVQGTSPLLPRSMKGLAAFALLTGSLDLCFGTGMVSGASEVLETASPVASFIDSQMRFLGATWAGYGALLWWASNDLKNRRDPLAILGVVMFAGGFGRLLSGLKHGFQPTWLMGAMVFEFLAPAAVYLTRS